MFKKMVMIFATAALVLGLLPMVGLLPESDAWGASTEPFRLPLVATDSVYFNLNRNRTDMRIYITESGELYDAMTRSVVDTDVRSVRYTLERHALSVFYLKTDGTLWAWGSNRSGQLGDNTGVNRSTPVKIMDDVAAFGVVDQRVWAIKTDRTYWVWGGIGNHIEYEPVLKAENIVRFIGASSLPGAMQTLILTSDGSIEYSHIQPNYPVPRYIGDITARSLVTASYANSYWLCWIDSDYVLWEREIIYTNADPNPDKDRVVAEDVVTLFVIDQGAVMYITSDGTLYGWGKNDNGQLGDGTRVPRREPVKIADNVRNFGFYSFIQTDGTLWGWTANDPVPRVRGYDVAAYIYQEVVIFNNGVISTRQRDGSFREEQKNVRIPERAVYD